MKEIILRLGNGSVETGFPSVNVELRDLAGGNSRSCWEATANLLPAPELKNIYEEWRFLYQASLRYGDQRGVSFAPATVTNFSIQDIQQITHNLTTNLNSWLNQGDFYHKVQAQLRTQLNADDRVVIAVVTDNTLLWQLPWHRWDFFDAYQYCVEFFSKPQFKSNREQQPQRNGRVDILAVWGDAPELDLAKDLIALNQPRAAVNSCQPQSALEISDRLAAEQIDILFFGGHGETIELDMAAGAQQNLGTIYLDKNTPIAIDKIKKDLKQAVDRGLQIAIFNCCSGLGLAEEIADLNIPYLIVMRSQIPDKLAQQFCRDLLLRYSQGYLFTNAFQYARDRLKPATDRTDEFESWLPMLFHNPNSSHVTWQQLCHSWWSVPTPPAILNASHWLTRPRHLPLTWLATSLLSTGITVGLQSLAPVQSLENLVVDRLQAIHVNMMPIESHVVIIDTSNKSDEKDTPLIIDGEFTSSDALFAPLSKTPFMAMASNIQIENTKPDSFLKKANVSINCAKQAQTMNNYLYQIDNNCSSLAGAITKNYPPINKTSHFNQFNILNPHIEKVIPRIPISQVDSNQDMLANKILIVGPVDEPSESALKNPSSTITEAVAIEQMVRAKNGQQPLLTPVTNPTKTIYILLWPGLNVIAVAYRKWLSLLPAAIVILSIAAGIYTFLIGYLVPLLPTLMAIIISSIVVALIKSSNNKANF